MPDTLIFYVIVTGILALPHAVSLCIVNYLLGVCTRARVTFPLEKEKNERKKKRN